ncbi:MAG: hypothetical protein ABEJ26_08160 [Halosimplex sp.]
MQRRTVLRGLAALAAGAGAGCTSANREVPETAPLPPAEIRDAGGDGGTGPGDGGSGDGDDAPDTPEGQRFVVPSRSFGAAGDGDLLVTLTVLNRADVAHRAVLTVNVGAGSKTFSPSRAVSLGPGESREFAIHVPVPYREFDREPNFDVSFDPGTPATPIPEGTVTPYPDDRATDTAAATDAATDTGGATDTVATADGESTGDPSADGGGPTATGTGG